MHLIGTGLDIKDLLFPAVEALPNETFRTPRYGLSEGEHFIEPRDLETRASEEETGVVEIFPKEGAVCIGLKIPDNAKDIYSNDVCSEFRYGDFKYKLYKIPQKDA
ncbi:unnamed protein product [marine sediment metagenome]|uniref:Uncharacterized protein n=1 Tax=marine sediment metagenome TaxID=412755 RepID=X0W9J6_9ZZZZ